MNRVRIWVGAKRSIGNKVVAEAELLSTAESHIWVMLDGRRRKVKRDRNTLGDYVRRLRYIRGRELATTSTNLEVIDLEDKPVRTECAAMNGCSKCGACCRHLGSPPFLATGAPDENGCLTDFQHEPTMPAELIAEVSNYRRALGAGGPDRGAEELPCFWYDAATKRCKHYRWRPNVCRDYLC